MDKAMNRVIATLKDKNISLGLCVVLAVYVSFMSGRFSEVSDFLKSNVGKLIMCSLIVFVSQHNVQLALMLSLVFITQVNEGFEEILSDEDRRVVVHQHMHALKTIKGNVDAHLNETGQSLIESGSRG